MKQGDKIKFSVQRLGGGGEGLAFDDGHTIVVPFALPKETVSARVVHVRRDGTAFASLLSVDKSASERTEPPCPVFGVCGGCQLMHMSYAAQLEFKRNLVSDNLKKIGGFNIELPEVVPSPCVLGYRNKVQQPVGFDGRTAFTGFFMCGTHDVVRVSRCLLQQKEARMATAVFEEFLNSRKISVYDEKTGKGLVRHFLARYADGQLLATVVANGGALPHWEKLYDALAQTYPKVGLFLNENRARSNVILGTKTVWLKGLKEIASNMCGVEFYLQPDSFFQVNTPVAEMIYREVKEQVLSCGTEVLIECFSGVGVLSAMLADDSYDSFGIEIVPSAWQDAQKIKEKNNLKRLTNICGDVNEELPKLACRCAGKNVTVVVDPPRKGLDKGVLSTLTDFKPQTIVYVSCDSATLARDLADFCASGYEVVFVRAFDMFPNTKHVETLVVLRRKP